MLNAHSIVAQNAQVLDEIFRDLESDLVAEAKFEERDINVIFTTVILRVC